MPTPVAKNLSDAERYRIREDAKLTPAEEPRYDFWLFWVENSPFRKERTDDRSTVPNPVHRRGT